MRRVQGEVLDVNAVKKLRKGSYELQFSKSGFHILSVIVQIDPSARTSGSVYGWPLAAPRRNHRFSHVQGKAGCEGNG
jgi:hypothetical protein